MYVRWDIRSNQGTHCRSGSAPGSWSGQNSVPSTATADDMHRLSEMLLPRITTRPGFDEERLKSKIAVEFVL